MADYDIAITNYFNADSPLTVFGNEQKTVLRYGENPHQTAVFFGDLNKCFDQLHGKEISYNNLVDIDAAIELVKEFEAPSGSPQRGETKTQTQLNQDTFNNIKDTQLSEPLSADPSPIGGGRVGATFAIIKHTNVCGIAIRNSVTEAWKDALAGDPESALVACWLRTLK